ncbi:hypothetical protein DFH09DRAFT_1092953 [Mycena vulgaris]|nr:hypothetical protein DFH09DRAFT_1092953 [Mycena vulgaris]
MPLLLWARCRHVNLNETFITLNIDPPLRVHPSSPSTITPARRSHGMDWDQGDEDKTGFTPGNQYCACATLLVGIYPVTAGMQNNRLCSDGATDRQRECNTTYLHASDERDPETFGHECEVDAQVHFAVDDQDRTFHPLFEPKPSMRYPPENAILFDNDKKAEHEAFDILGSLTELCSDIETHEILKGTTSTRAGCAQYTGMDTVH